MPTLLCTLAIVGLFLVAAVLFHHYRLQRMALSRVLHLISALAQGQYSRRTDPAMPHLGGELGRAANALAENLETRAASAQQDSDHLISLLAILDHTNEIALATDSLDVIRLANPAAARVLGRPVEQLLGRRIETVIHNPDLLALHKNAFHSGKPVSVQISLQSLAPTGAAGSGGGGRTLHCQATAATIYFGPHFRGTLLLLRDITEIARTFQIKTDFVANASHELRTPLASIRAAVETLKEAAAEDVNDQETIHKCTDIINNHALRLQMLVTDLLDLSRAEDSRAVVRSDRVDLASVCEMVTGMYARNVTEKHLVLHTELAPDALTFRGDERLLILTLKNLLDNAIKFTPASGSVTIRAYIQKNGQKQAESPSPRSPVGDQFVIEVEDTGCGIPPEDQERVFERFYTVNRSRGGADRGTGLGLAIVKHAVAAMGGQVTLASQLNHGTTLRCVFPQRVIAVEREPTLQT